MHIAPRISFPPATHPVVSALLCITYFLIIYLPPRRIYIYTTRLTCCRLISRLDERDLVIDVDSIRILHSNLTVEYKLMIDDLRDRNM